MAFVLPTFNITADIYTWSTTGLPTTPRLTVDCQLRPPAMTNASSSVASSTFHCGMVMLVAKETDVRDYYCAPGNSPDVVQCPPGSGRWYTVYYVDDVAKGFANEHRFVILQKYGFVWPTPIP